MSSDITSPPKKPAESPPRRVRPPREPEASVVIDYLKQRSSLFSALVDLREAGWNSAAGDTYFLDRENNADNADDATRKKFFKMMVTVLHQLDKATSAISGAGSPPSPLTVLDLCLAPGGFTQGTLQLRPGSRVKGITLPMAEGGHKVLLNLRGNADVMNVLFHDITMFSNEFGLPAKLVPEDHPDKARFVDFRPFAMLRFDLVFCDAQMLRTQERGEHRGHLVERIRLRASQILIALGRIKQGGTMVMLLNHMEAPQCIDIIRDIDSISEVTVWKPEKIWGVKSTFYLIAKKVRSASDEAKKLLEKYRELWRKATLDGVYPEWTEKEVEEMLKDYGDRVIQLGTETWRVQAATLKRSAFIRREMDKENQPVRELVDVVGRVALEKEI
ncbi:hypothetical protein EX30DRAFT_373177 [Ascodesmis nigricans]|uniref:Ribosomal RNA methyltransferase FtsJ domain-containing protein n=1 Tax=Ascodesmis nigricans TaxID=341454 RepID=A0A4S2MS39_9PEZI|nr:hypothetical protein EX30DRAFT_373177 [Ascodesmis nigricans]